MHTGIYMSISILWIEFGVWCTGRRKNGSKTASMSDAL